jgi:cysteine synthase A
VVELATAAVLAGEPITNPNHRIQGGCYSMPSLPFFTAADADGYIQVTEKIANQTCRKLARQEGVFAGFSSERMWRPR